MEDKKDRRTAQDLTDEELLFLIRYRYDDPIAILISRYSPLIASTARKYFLTGYDHEDLLQEGNMVLYRTLDRYESDNNVTFGHYLKQNVVNEFNSLLRKSMADKRKVDRLAVSLEAMSDAQDKTYWENYINQESYDCPEELAILKEQISTYKSTLSRMEIRVFELYLQGLSASEIAKKLDWPTPKAYNALSRCKKKLIKLIQEDAI